MSYRVPLNFTVHNVLVRIGPPERANRKRERVRTRLATIPIGALT